MQRTTTLKDFPLKDISFTEITLVRADGETLLSVAQKEKNWEYLKHFYMLALDFFKTSKGGIDVESTYDDNPITLSANDLEDNEEAEIAADKQRLISQQTHTRHGILWYAIQLLQNEKILKMLLKEGCKSDTVFLTKGFSQSAFFTAIEIENTVAMHVLNSSSKSALVNTPNDAKLLPAHWAAKNGKLTALKYLHIMDNKLIHARSATAHCERTCLHFAVLAKQKDTAIWLLTNHPDARHQHDTKGFTPAHYLVIADNDDELLTNALIAIDDNNVTTGQHAEFPNKTPLQLAIELGKLKVLTRLYQLKQEMFKPIATGAAGNCLHLAAEKNKLTSVQWLLEHFPQMKDETDIYGYTPLHYAVLNDNEDMVKALCDAHANVNIKSNNRAKLVNKSPVQLAVEHNQKNLVAILLPLNGYTVAHYAIIQKDKGLLGSLLTHKWDCNSLSSKTDTHGEVTPLQLAAMLGDSEMVRLMLQSKIEPSTANSVTDFDKLSQEMQTALKLIAYIPLRKQEENTNSYFTQFTNFTGATYGEAEKTAVAEKLLQYLINGIENPISLMNDRERDVLCNGRLKDITQALMKQYEASLTQKAAVGNN